MQRAGFVPYREFRYLKLSAAVVLLSALMYVLLRPAGGAAYGGTVYGYVSGTVSALLVGLLAWYGIRKRVTPRVQERRKSDRRRRLPDPQASSETRRSDRRKQRAEATWRYGGTLEAWLSAHIYLGGLVLVLATLHAGFRIGWNLHTLTYALLWGVVVSGLHGVFAYLYYPRQITEQTENDSLEDLLLRLREIDELARTRALLLPDEVNAVVARAREETRIGGGFFQQLIFSAEDCPTDLAVETVQAYGKTLLEHDQPRQVRDLYTVLLQRQRLLARIRRVISLNARMQIWLYLHVPLAIALLASLLAHILSVLIYW